MTEHWLRLLTWWRTHPVVGDALVAVALFAVTMPGLWYKPEALVVDVREPDLLGALLVVGATLPLAWRRLRPEPVLVTVLVSSAALGALSYFTSANGISVLIALYTVASLCRLRVSLLAYLAVVGSYVVVALLDTYPWGALDLVAAAAIFFGGWAFGRSVLIRRAYTATLEERAAQLEAARVADARTAVSEERGRIARELHDVVAHHVSVMTVQATAAQRMLERDPALAREAMAAVESTGRAALGEMRSIVGVLREGAGERADALAPQPRLADLDCLLVSLREAGLRVALVRSGDLTDLPAGIDLALYRIVQEALTNTLRHAGPTSAEVTLVRSTHAVQVRVVDSGRGAAAALNGGGCPGHGLIGMRERVGLYGGELTAGPRSGGGYIVEASIPLVPTRRVAPEARPAAQPPTVPSPPETRGEPARPVLPGRPGVPA